MEKEKELPWVTVGSFKRIKNTKEIGKRENVEKIETSSVETVWVKMIYDDCK